MLYAIEPLWEAENIPPQLFVAVRCTPTKNGWTLGVRPRMDLDFGTFNVGKLGEALLRVKAQELYDAAHAALALGAELKRWSP